MVEFLIINIRFRQQPFDVTAVLEELRKWRIQYEDLFEKLKERKPEVKMQNKIVRDKAPSHGRRVKTRTVGLQVDLKSRNVC